MAVTEIGWSTLVEAEAYFSNNRLETSEWDLLSTDDKKNKCLNTGYNRIIYAKQWSVPASPTVAQLVKLKIAQQEMAYYIALHLSDEDRRKGLQAQGVIKAGIIKEDYYAEWLDKLPFPPIVINILEEFIVDHEFFAMDIDRDEDRAVTDNVTDF